MDKFLIIDNERLEIKTNESESPKEAFDKVKMDLNCKDFTHYKLTNSHYGYFKVIIHKIHH